MHWLAWFNSLQPKEPLAWDIFQLKEILALFFLYVQVVQDIPQHRPSAALTAASVAYILKCPWAG